MHISDGILPISISIAGYVAASSITYYNIKKINKMDEPEKEIPKVSILTACFFISSTIHIPIPPTSIHMLLIGIMGILLGNFSFLAVIIGLFFQAVIFGHGGIVSLGINSVIFGFPALCCSYLYKVLKPYIINKLRCGTIGFLIGLLGVLISTLMFVGIMIMFIPSDINVVAEKYAIIMLAVGHIPLAIMEGIITGGILIYIMKVNKKLLGLNSNE
jgi:cobalt/nickel transport system permease protein